MLGDDEWGQLTRDWSQTREGSGKRVLAAVLDMQDRLSILEAQVTEALAHEGVSRREHALKAARAHIAEMEAEKANSRGYRDNAMRSPERIDQEIKVANFLLGQGE